MDLQNQEGQFIMEDSEEKTLFGYKRDRNRTIITWIAIVLSAFLLRLVFHWKPEWFLKATHIATTLRQAEKILVVDQYGEVWVHNIHITTQDGTAVKLLKQRHGRHSGRSSDIAYEMESSYQDDTLLKYFVNKKIKYMWNWKIDQFERVKTLNEELPCDPRSLPHLSFREAMRRRVIYGINIIDVPITPLITVFLLQALHPFYVFQVFSCALWYSDDYWMYATCIVIESILGLTMQVFETRRNERQLRNTITNSGMCIVQREGDFREMSSELLVPGDIIELPRSGCDMSCDAVLISGHAIVNESLLTGESVPVSKVPLPFKENDDSSERIDIKENARHILFNGTHVVQTRNYEDERVLAVVLRTGFATSKGELVRAIMFPKPIEFKFDRDILNYLIVLSVFGIIGFIFTIVLMVMYNKPTSLIVRRALDIFTIIVPPALPAAMSVGLVMSIRRLKANRIYCIAPRYINSSGCANLVVFDKTGTITEEGLDLRRVIYSSSSGLVEEKDVGCLDPRSPIVMCMAAAHSLAKIDGEVCGDPIDIKMFAAVGWKLSEPVLGRDGGDTVQQMVPREVTYQSSHISQLGGSLSIGLLREFPFSSSLQRMAVLGRVLGDSHYTVFVKGSPEVIFSLCHPETVPAGIHASLELYTQRGYRVLGLAWRKMERLTVVRAHRISREDVEKDLRFCGLLVMENRLKPESEPTISALKLANMRVVMATGDNILTAVSVAHDCGIIDAEDRILSVTSHKHNDRPMEVMYREISENRKRIVSESDTSAADILLNCRTRVVDPNYQPGKNAKICLSMTGKVWADIRESRPDLIPKLVCLGTVFARFSPEQKAQLVEELQAIDYSVLMCGDGANDCGALKAAHSGISLSEAEASVASPFTSKDQNISCTLRLIKEGRCAIVTSFGIFKYMAGYSLTQFISVLIVYLLKLNLTDGQYLYIDLFIITSLSITFGYTRPAETLSRIPPPRRLITIPVILSIVLLQVVNMGVMIWTLYFVQRQPWFVERDEYKAVVEEVYASYENTCIFIVSAFQYITLAIIFAKGRPYRRNLLTNYIFVINLAILLFFTLYIAFSPLPFLKTFLELVDTPIGRNDLKFRAVLVGAASANFLLCALIEWSLDSLRFREIIQRLRKIRLLPSGKPKKHVVINKIINENSWPLTELERSNSVSNDQPSEFLTNDENDEVWKLEKLSENYKRDNQFELESCSLSRL